MKKQALIVFGLVLGLSTLVDTGCAKESSTSDTAETSGTDDGGTDDGMDTTAGTTTTDGGDGDGDASSTGDGDPCQPIKANGETCDVYGDCECMSGSCFEVPILSNVCGECKLDADCPDGGCTPPNPLPGNEAGAFCNSGEAGGGCESTEACQDGLTCELILDLGALGLVINTCSECSTDMDCADGQVCGVEISIADFAGRRLCQDAGSVANGAFCSNSNTTGNDACASGFCGVVEVEGLVMLDVCGECIEDTDCAMGEVCTPGSFDLAGFSVTGATCTPA